MRNSTILAVLAAAVLIAPACTSTSTSTTRWGNVEDGALMNRTLRSYHAINSAFQGKVGYVKVFDVTEAGGPVYQWKYVYDLDYRELGFIDQFGKAYRYHELSEIGQEAMQETMTVTEMPADSAERNTMRMLGIDPATDDVTFPMLASDS
jgi:hypothetical protein